MALLRCSKKGLGAVLMQREKEGPRTTKGSGLSEGHYGLGFPTQILRAQTEARKQKTSRRRMLEVYWLRIQKIQRNLERKKVGTTYGWNYVLKWQEWCYMLWRYLRDYDHARVTILNNSIHWVLTR
ncbi:hypothetical protein Tco_0340345 [Tanacetum coccineum]